MKKFKHHRLIRISLFSAISFLLMLFEFNIPLLPYFLKMGFSDLPALIIAFIYGPVDAILIAGGKNLLHLFITTNLGIGELANFLIGASLVGSTAFAFKKLNFSRIASLVIGCIIMTIAALVVNLYIILPLYERVLALPVEQIIELSSQVNPAVNDLRSYLAFVILPFNVFKGTILSIITILLLKRFPAEYLAYKE